MLAVWSIWERAVGANGVLVILQPVTAQGRRSWRIITGVEALSSTRPLQLQHHTSSNPPSLRNQPLLLGASPRPGHLTLDPPPHPFSALTDTPLQPAMPATTAETLSLVTRNVSVAPLVLLSAADHYGRTAKGTKKRVVGVLLGQNDGKNVRVSNSFAGKLPMPPPLPSPHRRPSHRLT